MRRRGPLSQWLGGRARLSARARRATINLSLGMLVAMVFVVLLVAMGALSASRTKKEVQDRSKEFTTQVRSQLLSANPVAKACSLWFSQGLGMPTAANYYKVPSSSKYAAWGCCDDLEGLEHAQLNAQRVNKCLKSCGQALSLLERCSQDWDIMDGGKYEDAQTCYKSRFDKDVRCAS